MAPLTRTLLDYLATPNPPINSEHSWLGSNTNTTGSMWCAVTKLKIWKEFKFDTIVKLHKDILNREFSEEDLPSFDQELPYHLTEIRNENTLNSLLIRWNNAVVSAALAASQNLLSRDAGSRDGEEGEIFMACGCQATVNRRKGLDHNKKIPDWAGIMKKDIHEVSSKDGKRMTHTNLLPGETKLSTKWTSENINNTNKNNARVKAPINQLLTYCANAQVRYGYIITQKELVVFRIYERPNNSPEPSKPKLRQPPKDPKLGTGKHEWDMEYQAIPWKPEDETQSDTLTVNLSLWWLHMLAAQERSLQGIYPKLGTECLNPEADDPFSSFGNKDSQKDDDTDSNPRDSQLSFTSKRSREDDEDSLDVSFGRNGKRASKRRGGIPHDVSLSFGSHIST